MNPVKNKYLPIITPVKISRLISKWQLKEEQEIEKKNSECKWADDELVVLYGMQNIIILPRRITRVLLAYRIFQWNVCFWWWNKGNETKATGALWLADIKERSTTDLASIYISFFITYRDIKIEISWSSWFFLVNNCSVAKEARHVFVSANNFNHKLVQSIYQKKKVDNFQHFNDIINSRGKASVMNFSNFSAFPKRVYESSQTSNKHKPEEIQAFKSQIFNIYAK